MKLNIIIRVYDSTKLDVSLFDLPNKISSDMAEIYLHNDNPMQEELFQEKITLFTYQYPEYQVHLILEKKNLHMFMSFMNTIPYLNDANKFTMLLDEDDQLMKIDSDFIDWMSTLSEDSQILFLCVLNQETRNSTNAICLHRIHSTSNLKWMYSYKDIIVELLQKHNNTTKISYGEETLVNRIIGLRKNVKTYTAGVLMTHNIYDHSANGYVSNNPGSHAVKPAFYKHFFIEFKKAVMLREPELINSFFINRQAGPKHSHRRMDIRNK